MNGTGIGNAPYTIECSHNRNVLVNLHVLLVNLTIKYFNDINVVEFKVFTLFYKPILKYAEVMSHIHYFKYWTQALFFNVFIVNHDNCVGFLNDDTLKFRVLY